MTNFKTRVSGNSLDTRFWYRICTGNLATLACPQDQELPWVITHSSEDHRPQSVTHPITDISTKPQIINACLPLSNCMAIKHLLPQVKQQVSRVSCFTSCLVTLLLNASDTHTLSILISLNTIKSCSYAALLLEKHLKLLLINLKT